jgi:hypothetical protein
MAFLTECPRPTAFTLARIVRTRRKAVIDETLSLVTLYHETLRLEITLPSLRAGLKSALAGLRAKLSQAFAPPFRGWCYVA